MQPIRTLILSGGGGRGAFHAGVYKYLTQANKALVDEDHRSSWHPDIVVGTSIGAVNGAAIVAGSTSEELESVWRSLRESDIQGLPPGMRAVSKWMSNLILRQFIGVTLPKVPAEQSTSPSPQDSWLPLPIRPNWLAEKLIGRWSNFLDTGPLRQTLEKKFKISPLDIAASRQTLLINATNVRTGERVSFSNHPITSRTTGKIRNDVITGITYQRILASCSIPLVYPWTIDEATEDVYWDGAVVANTPLSGALDAAQDISLDVPMEAVVVLMTPWIQGTEHDTLLKQPLPQSFSEAVTWTLDWALLATFRERLRVTQAYNRLARLERQIAVQQGPDSNYPLQYRLINVVIVAPKVFFPMARIIDYDERTDLLIKLGYEAAEAAFIANFPAPQQEM